MAGRGTDIKLGEGVIELGGLKIVGTERHESRRIDNQLRGRAGRQGDPGESRFYLSMEDDLMRLFGSEKTAAMIKKLGLPEDEPIEAGILTKAIENAQKKVEGNNFSARKRLLDYDQVMNEQRELIYAQRKEVLTGENLKEEIMSMTKEVITRIVDACCGTDETQQLGIWMSLNAQLKPEFDFTEQFELSKEDIQLITKEKLVDRIFEAAKG